MPRKIKSLKKIVGTVDDVQSPENHRLLQNRVYRFKELLGQDVDEAQLNRLVYSKVDYWDLDNLLKKGCEPELAIKILM